MKTNMKILAIGVLIAVAGATSQALAQAFKLNKVVYPLVDAQRENWTALPYSHPYRDMQKVCDALNLTNGNPNAKVRRVDPAPGGQLPSWNCGDLGTAPCLQNDSGSCSFPVGGTPEHVKRAGLIITNNVATGGLIVGAHVGNPPGTITLKPLGASPVGFNYFSPPYHFKAPHVPPDMLPMTMRDVCNDLGLPGTLLVPNALVARRNADALLFPSPNTSWDCGAVGVAPGWELGQALRITYQVNAIITGDITLPPGRPSTP